MNWFARNLGYWCDAWIGVEVPPAETECEHQYNKTRHHYPKWVYHAHTLQLDMQC